MQMNFAARDKEAITRALKNVEDERDRLVSEQSQADELRRTTEQVAALAELLGKSESTELVELRHLRDQSKILEGEYVSLKKRVKEQENRFSNAERLSIAARNNLEQAQKRAADWEEKARAYEAEVEQLTTALDQAEQTKNQLDADYSLARLQLEEKDAEDRITKVTRVCVSFLFESRNNFISRTVKGS
jgi:chromosome segregation ATPase